MFNCRQNQNMLSDQPIITWMKEDGFSECCFFTTVTVDDEDFDVEFVDDGNLSGLYIYYTYYI